MSGLRVRVPRQRLTIGSAGRGRCRALARAWLDTWLGVLLGAALYIGSRIFAREEEATLSRTFGEQWRDYRRHVRLGWL